MTPDGRRVLIADDQASVRSALRALLDTEPGVVVVGEAHDGASAIALLETCAPHCVVVDVTMPGGGPELVRRIRADAPGVPVIAISACGDGATRQAMLDAGVVAFVEKGSADAVLDAIRTALEL